MKQASDEGEQITVLASASPGADILVHVVCAELDVPSRLCLPMRPDDVARVIFADAVPWRTRLNAVVKTHLNSLLQLGDEADLPQWLQGRTSIDPWEPGNRWVM